MRGLAWLVGALIGASVVTAGIPAGAQSEPYSGGGDYQVYCSSCHGASGKGDGSIAKSLKKRPSDLTQLAKLNNGVFPGDKVFKTVDGRTPGSAHSDSDMPAWGDVFAKSIESQGTENAAMRIRTLVKYLETLQAK
jgi:mono/diheme cytochrome c family protein